jgi:hypothetical protein
VIGAVQRGAAAQCPNNQCGGNNQYNLPVQFRATTAGSYYSVLIPGTWSSATDAGEVAVGSTNGESIATNTEVSGNIYRLKNGRYSWTLPSTGDAASSGFNPDAIPPGTTYAGNYHDHGAFDPNYLNEQFSLMGCNGGQLCDIGNALSGINRGQPSFLGTPSGRTELYDPANANALPFGCVLIGPAVVAGPENGSIVDVPPCP